MLPSACFIIWFHASFYTIKEIKFTNDYGAALQMRRSGAFVNCVANASIGGFYHLVLFFFLRHKRNKI